MNSKIFGLAVVAVGGALFSLLREKQCGAKALQPYFNALHDDIKLGHFEENAVLRDKRDLLIRELKESLPDTLPSWYTFNQGSYAMGTGINPNDGDFDIDVGIVFECMRSDIPDPVELKREICLALSKGNRTVQVRRPCVTIRYMRDGVIDYHVDLAIYVKRENSRTLDLAFGKLHSASHHRHWSEQDPFGLVDKVRHRFSQAEAEQFRRCIRYLKAWRNKQFKNGGAPLSIALTCAAYAWFKPHSSEFLGNKPADAEALKHLVNSILENITRKAHIQLPVTPETNLLEKMTPRQFQTFINKLVELRNTLEVAMALPATKLEEACRLLESQFTATDISVRN